MPLTKPQIDSLLGMVESAEQDDLDCDSCFVKVTEFAEAKLASREIPDALKAVEVHLQQCICCQDEFNALMQGLQALQD